MFKLFKWWPCSDSSNACAGGKYIMHNIAKFRVFLLSGGHYGRWQHVINLLGQLLYPKNRGEEVLYQYRITAVFIFTLKYCNFLIYIENRLQMVWCCMKNDIKDPIATRNWFTPTYWNNFNLLQTWSNIDWEVGHVISKTKSLKRMKLFAIWREGMPVFMINGLSIAQLNGWIYEKYEWGLS